MTVPIRRRFFAFIMIAPIALIVAAVACRAPTELTLRLRTDVSCAELGEFRIAVGSDIARAQSALVTGHAQVTGTRCVDGELGTLVISNGSSQGALAIAAVLKNGASLDACIANGFTLTDCLIARRTFTFLDGVALALTVNLRAVCRGVACTLLTTCSRGGCVSTNVSCDDSGACTDETEDDASHGEADATASFDASLANDARATLDAMSVHDAPADSRADATDGDSADHCELHPTTPPMPDYVCCYNQQSNVASWRDPMACAMGVVMSQAYRLDCTDRADCAATEMCGYQNGTLTCLPYQDGATHFCRDNSGCASGQCTLHFAETYLTTCPN